MSRPPGPCDSSTTPRSRPAKGEQLINWNRRGRLDQQGPQGPAGPADWNAIGNIPAGFADGVDNEGYVTETVSCDNPVVSSGEYVTFTNLPRNMVHEFMVVPTGDVFLYVDRVEFSQFGSAPGTLRADVHVETSGTLNTGTCNIRRISFTDGISIAKARQQLKGVDVSYTWRAPGTDGSRISTEFDTTGPLVGAISSAIPRQRQCSVGGAAAARTGPRTDGRAPLLLRDGPRSDPAMATRPIEGLERR